MVLLFLEKVLEKSGYVYSECLEGLVRLCSLENARVVNYYKCLLVGEIHIPKELQYISQPIDFHLVHCPKMYTLAEENKLRKSICREREICLTVLFFCQISCLSPNPLFGVHLFWLPSLYILMWIIFLLDKHIQIVMLSSF